VVCRVVRGHELRERKGVNPPGVQCRIRSLGCNQPVFAKLARAEAIDRRDEVLAIADGIMIARGDMAVKLAARGGGGRDGQRG
jgi:pyruvate kinase